MPHTYTADEIRTSEAHTAQFVALADYHEMARAFHERTQALTERADECISLTNERDALRAALRCLTVQDPITYSADASLPYKQLANLFNGCRERALKLV